MKHLCCLLLLPAVSAILCPERKAVFLDAGSTSTKVKIYSWIDKTPHINSIPNITLESSVRVSPGLSDFEDNVDAISVYLSGIISMAKDRIPQDQWNSTEILVMATAGLRFVSATGTKAVMDEVRTLLRNQTFSPFRYERDDVQVLSGEEEAIYAWISANYLKDVFQLFGPSTESFGVMELGGGSTQIAFVPEVPLYSEEFQVSLAGNLYQVYVQSYLNFGADGIQRQILSELIRNGANPQEVLNPCMLKDDVKTITMLDGAEITTKGTGDGSTCLEILQGILRPATGDACWPRPCAIGSVYQPTVGTRKFFATSAFKFAPETLNAVGQDGVLNLQALHNNALSNCSKSINDVPSDSAAFASSNYCLNGLYISTLLNLSYGFPMDCRNIFVTSKINGKDIDWALGAMILDISRSKSKNNMLRKRK